VSTAIKSSLVKLNEAVERLETSMKSASATPAKTAQTDLFGAVSGKKAANAGSNIDAKALARRLDSTIDRVEKLLKEGRA
jgi:hypothetical protein